MWTIIVIAGFLITTLCSQRSITERIVCKRGEWITTPCLVNKYEGPIIFELLRDSKPIHRHVVGFESRLNSTDISVSTEGELRVRINTHEQSGGYSCHWNSLDADGMTEMGKIDFSVQLLAPPKPGRRNDHRESCGMTVTGIPVPLVDKQTFRYSTVASDNQELDPVVPKVLYEECVATNVVGSSMFRSTMEPGVKPYRRYIEVDAGSNVDVYCPFQATGTNLIKWHTVIGKDLLGTDKTPNSQQFSDGSLRMWNVSSADIMDVYCTEQTFNDSRVRSSEPIRLSIDGPPYVSISETASSSRKSHETNIQCYFKSSSKGQIELWHLSENKSMFLLKQVQIIAGTVRGRIQYTADRTKRYGKFFCRAQNEKGRNQSEDKLIVQWMETPVCALKTFLTVVGTQTKMQCLQNKLLSGDQIQWIEITERGEERPLNWRSNVMTISTRGNKHRQYHCIHLKTNHSCKTTVIASRDTGSLIDQNIEKLEVSDDNVNITFADDEKHVEAGFPIKKLLMIRMAFDGLNEWEEYAVPLWWTWIIIDRLQPDTPYEMSIAVTDRDSGKYRYGQIFKFHTKAAKRKELSLLRNAKPTHVVELSISKAVRKGRQICVHWKSSKPVDSVSFQLKRKGEVFARSPVLIERLSREYCFNSLSGVMEVKMVPFWHFGHGNAVTVNVDGDERDDRDQVDWIVISVTTVLAFFLSTSLICAMHLLVTFFRRRRMRFQKYCCFK